MKRLAAIVLGWSLACGACGASDGVDDSGGDDKSDRPSQAADRGTIDPGTTRRVRFTEAGQTHAFKMTVRAGAIVGIQANPLFSQTDTLKTTLKLYGPVGDDGKLPAEPLGSVKDFPLDTKLEKGGEYRIIVGTTTKKMTGTYDLSVECSNHACAPHPVSLAQAQTPKPLADAGDGATCGDHVCPATTTVYHYDGDRPTVPALAEAALAKLSQGDEDWFSLEPMEASAVESELKASGLLTAARDFADARDIEAFKVPGLVQIPIDDSGTDGFDQDVYVLHFPKTSSVVVLLVRP